MCTNVSNGSKLNMFEYFLLGQCKEIEKLHFCINETNENSLSCYTIICLLCFVCNYRVLVT
jgi:hypothetical protein